MNDSNNHFVYAKPRHFRFLFFVENEISAKALTNLFHGNLKRWGGRYNPIIPVSEGKVSPAYMELIRQYDPDIVFYTSKIDIQKIKTLNLFNCQEFVELDDRGNYQFGGVDYHYILSDQIRDFLFHDQKLPILHIQGAYQIDIKAKEFYETNFGLFDLYSNQDHLIRGFDVIPITKENHAEINKIIYHRRPYFKSILSQLKIVTNILRPKDFQANQWFELIVSDTSVSNEDLFYFWNRQQYIELNKRLYQIIIDKEDLKTLIEDPYFEGVLMDLQIDSTIFFTSKTIPQTELEKIREDVQSKLKKIKFNILSPQSFPYEILDFRYKDELVKEKRKQIFTNRKDLLKLEAPNLNGRLSVKGGFVFDIEIEKNPSNKLKFPNSFPIYNGRVNMNHDQSIFVSGQLSTLDFDIPTESEIFQTRLLYLKGEDDKLIKTLIENVKISNAGQKLFAMLNLFSHDWDNLMHFVNDKFWLDLFRYDSEFRDESNIPKGKGVFSYKDLVQERRLLYGKYKASIEAKFSLKASKENIDLITDDDFKNHINQDLQNLININGLFMGLKVKCSNCGANKWYSLKETQDRMPCKGCNTVVIPKLETPFYYRSNEIIVNNLLNDLTGKSKDFNGNYVVLKALNYLKRQSHLAFSFGFPMDYSIKMGRDQKWKSDIDILAIQDGKLILGEAKCDASEFRTKEIEDLIWIGNHVIISLIK